MQALLVVRGFADRRKKPRFGGTIPPKFRDKSDHGTNREIRNEKYIYN